MGRAQPLWFCSATLVVDKKIPNTLLKLSVVHRVPLALSLCSSERGAAPSSLHLPLAELSTAMKSCFAGQSHHLLGPLLHLANLPRLSWTGEPKTDPARPRYPGSPSRRWREDHSLLSAQGALGGVATRTPCCALLSLSPSPRATPRGPLPSCCHREAAEQGGMVEEEATWCPLPRPDSRSPPDRCKRP